MSRQEAKSIQHQPDVAFIFQCTKVTWQIAYLFAYLSWIAQYISSAFTSQSKGCTGMKEVFTFTWMGWHHIQIQNVTLGQLTWILSFHPQFATPCMNTIVKAVGFSEIKI